MTDQDRIFAILREQDKILARIDENQRITHERLFGNGQIPGVIPFLHTEVTKHTRQITFWKGGIAVLTFLWSAVAAYATAVLSKHR